MRRTLAALAMTAALILSGCGPLDPGPVGSAPAVPITEALWLVDESGTLLAYDGWSDQVAARAELGPSASGWQLAGSGPQLWAYATTGRVLRIDPATARITAERQLTSGPATLYLTGTVLWVRQPGILWRLDADTGPDRVGLPNGVAVTAVAADAHGLWAAGADARLYRITTDGTVGPVGAPALAAGVTALAGGPVLATPTGVTALDPASGSARWTVPLPGPVIQAGPVALYGDGDTAWAANAAATVRLQPGPTQNQPGGTPGVLGPDSLWLGDATHRELVRIPLAGDGPVSRAQLAFATAGVGNGLTLTLAAGRESVWVADTEHGSGLSRVDPGSNRVVRLFPQRGTARFVAAVVADPPAPS